MRRSTRSRACLVPSLSVPYRYRPDVLKQLSQHGVQPDENTRPELVRDFVRDLYKYEIRCLRERYMRRDFPKVEYAGRVEILRRRYNVLSLQAWQFVEPSENLKSEV